METSNKKRVCMLISDKVNFRTKKKSKGKKKNKEEHWGQEGHWLMRRESGHQEHSNVKCKCTKH